MSKQRPPSFLRIKKRKRRGDDDEPPAKRAKITPPSDVLQTVVQFLPKTQALKILKSHGSLPSLYLRTQQWTRAELEAMEPYLTTAEQAHNLLIAAKNNDKMLMDMVYAFFKPVLLLGLWQSSRVRQLVLSKAQAIADKYTEYVDLNNLMNTEWDELDLDERLLLIKMGLMQGRLTEQNIRQIAQNEATPGSKPFLAPLQRLVPLRNDDIDYLFGEYIFPRWYLCVVMVGGIIDADRDAMLKLFTQLDYASSHVTVAQLKTVFDFAMHLIPHEYTDVYDSYKEDGVAIMRHLLLTRLPNGTYKIPTATLLKWWQSYLQVAFQEHDWQGSGTTLVDLLSDPDAGEPDKDIRDVIQNFKAVLTIRQIPIEIAFAPLFYKQSKNAKDEYDITFWRRVLRGFDIDPFKHNGHPSIAFYAIKYGNDALATVIFKKELTQKDVSFEQLNKLYNFAGNMKPRNTFVLKRIYAIPHFQKQYFVPGSPQFMRVKQRWKSRVSPKK